MFKGTTLAFLIGLILVSIPTPAGARGKPILYHCGEDAERFCPQVPIGEQERLVKCLRRHQGNLTARCWAHLKKEKRGPTRGTCEKDIRKYCKDVKPGGGRITQCLRQHERHLSGECRTSLERD